MALFERKIEGKPTIGCDSQSIYSFALLIRRTEELLLRLFSQGLLSGTTHTCIGQELCAMSVVRALNNPADVVLSNHRNHGHFLTYSGDFLGLVAEIMGRSAGVCGGIGGSQHLAFRGFHSNGVQGGMTAIGAGHALALKRREENGIVVVIIGDGTTGQGLLYESLNLASIWAVPMLFVLENNNIAQTTPTADTVGGSLEARGSAFGLRTWHLDDSDPDFLKNSESVVEEIRASGQPGFLVIDTCRLSPHSKGDDLREPKVMDALRARDPLARLGRDLGPNLKDEIDNAADEFLNEVYRQAMASPEAKFNEPKRHIFVADRIPPDAFNAITDNIGTNVRSRQKIYQKIVELAKQQGKDATSLRFQDSIPDFGMLDSPALWELIVWFENEFGLEIEPEQLTVENFGTIDAMASYAEKAGI